MITDLSALLDALPAYAGHEAAAPMLPPWCYASSEFFAFEREAVFAKNWVCVGRTDQLAAPGDVFSFSVAGEPLIVARCGAGDIRVLGAVCQHRGHVLPDLADRAAAVREGAGKIWAQDVPVNNAMQAGKHSRFMPRGTYGPPETTLVQFNAWLLRCYRWG